MCRQLQVSPVSPDCAYRELVSTLCVHDRAKEVLKEAAGMMTPNSRCYMEEKRYWTGKWCCWNEAELYGIMEEAVEQGIQAPTIITTPETILDNIHSVVKDGYSDMFRQSLYIYMGDCYHFLSAHLSTVATSLSNRLTVQIRRLFWCNTGSQY